MSMVNTKHKSAYNALVKKIFHEMALNLKLENKAKKYLALHLYRMTARMAFTASGTAAGKSLLEFGDIYAVLPEFLSSKALEVAMSNGSQNVFEYHHGLLPFEPRQPRSSRRTRRPHDPAEQLPSNVFRNGLRKLMTETDHDDPPTRIDEGCKQILEMISSIGIYIASDVAEDARRQGISEIDFTNVERSIANILPQELLELAKYIGMMRVEDHVKGILKYKKHIPSLKFRSRTVKSRKGKILSGKRSPKAKLKRKGKSQARRVTPKRVSSPRKKSRKRKTQTEFQKTKKKSKSPKARSQKVTPKARKRGPASKSKTPKRAKRSPEESKKTIHKVSPRKRQRQMSPRKTKDEVKEKPVKVKELEKINFNPYITNTITKVFSAKINHDAATRINDCLSDVCRSLICECSSFNATERKLEISERTVRSAVKKLFPDTMKQHALAAAHRAFFIGKSDLHGISSLEVTGDEIQAKVITKAKRKPDLERKSSLPSTSRTDKGGKKSLERNVSADDFDDGASAETLPMTGVENGEDMDVEEDQIEVDKRFSKETDPRETSEETTSNISREEMDVESNQSAKEDEAEDETGDTEDESGDEDEDAEDESGDEDEDAEEKPQQENEEMEDETEELPNEKEEDGTIETTE